MRKLALTAIAMIAFAGSAFANNEVVFETISDSTFSNCDLTTVEKTKDGGSRIVHYDLGSGISRGDCDKRILSQLDSLEKQGTAIAKYTTCFDSNSN